MTKSGASQTESAAELISKKFDALEDWRGKALACVHKLIRADACYADAR